MLLRNYYKIAASKLTFHNYLNILYRADSKPYFIILVVPN